MPEEIPLDSLPIISNRAYGTASMGRDSEGVYHRIQVDDSGYVVLSPQSIQAIVEAVLKAVLADQPGGLRQQINRWLRFHAPYLPKWLPKDWLGRYYAWKFISSMVLSSDQHSHSGSSDSTTEGESK